MSYTAPPTRGPSTGNTCWTKCHASAKDTRTDTLNNSLGRRALNSKRQYSSQRLITDSFKRQKVHNTTIGYNDRKRTASPHKESLPKRSRTSARYGQNITIPQTHAKAGTPRKMTKKKSINNAIFSKLCY